MGKVFFDVGMTLDGFIAGPSGGPKNPLGDSGLRIHDWMFEQKAFRQHLRIGNDGKTGPDNDLIEQTLRRIGANIMGRRMFDEGEPSWPDDTFQAAPVFVITHHVRPSWKRSGGDIFHFIDEPIQEVLEKAKDAADSHQWTQWFILGALTGSLRQAGSDVASSPLARQAAPSITSPRRTRVENL